MATRVPPSSEIFPGEPNQYSGLKANQAEHRSKMKHDRVELLFLHTPSPVDQQASFKDSRMYIFAHAHSTVTNRSLRYRRARVTLLQRPPSATKRGTPSGPIPKFASARVTFRCELRNLRTTSNFMILVRL